MKPISKAEKRKLKREKKKENQKKGTWFVGAVLTEAAKMSQLSV